MRAEDRVHPQGVQPWGNFLLSGKKHIRSSGKPAALRESLPRQNRSKPLFGLQNSVNVDGFDGFIQEWAVSGTWTTSCCYRFCSSSMPGPSSYALEPAELCTAFVCTMSSGEP